MNGKHLLNYQLEASDYNYQYALRDNQSLIQKLNLYERLQAHGGCVNTITWSDDDPRYILSGSDDQCLSITDAFSGLNKIKIHTPHRTNIFSAKFLPNTNSEKLISSSAGGDVYLTDITQPTIVNNENHFCCHGEKACYELRTFSQDPFIFISCGQDGACKWVDTRMSSKCAKSSCQEHTLIKLLTGISAIAVNPIVPYHLVCAGMDGVVRMFDRRMLSVGDELDQTSVTSIAKKCVNGLFACFMPPSRDYLGSAGDAPAMGIPTGGKDSLSNIPFVNNKRITSVQYDRTGAHLLVSYHPNKIYLLDWRDLSDSNDENSKQSETSEENLNDEREVKCDAESCTDQLSAAQNSSMAGRKFRIQTDWSDTGPNSLSFNEMENSDPRTFLARRLNDWFNNLTRDRRGNTATTTTTPASPNTNETTSRQDENQASSTSTLPSPLAENEPNDNSSPSEMDESSSSSPENRTSTVHNRDSTIEDDSDSVDADEEAAAADKSNPDNEKKKHLFSYTNSLIKTRIRTRQAGKLENNIIKMKPSPKIKMIYTGHRNARTIIKECNFWGNNYVISGSDCGHIFFWNKNTGKIVNILEADKHVVNCVQENSLFPVLASSGIDYDIKIWQPTLEQPVNGQSKIETITKRNKEMLEENKNTIFIPVQFMLPALRLFGANFSSRGNSRNAPSGAGSSSAD